MTTIDRRTAMRGATLAAAAAWLPRRALAAEGQSSADPALDRFIAALPKAEYHVHLEGTLEAEMKFALARRNGLKLPFADVAAMKASYRYHDLPSFLAIYYDGMKVLVTERDFHDLAYAYLARAAANNVLYAEMFFDPQEHIKRGVAMNTMLEGITRARRNAQAKLGIRSQLILCFVRDLPPDTAMAALEAALPLKQHLIGVGLDSDEKGHPPAQFAEHFARARAAGLHVTAHCDVNQQGTHENLRQAIEDIRVERIDHGGNIVERPDLVAKARAAGLMFTVCPTFSGTLRDGAQPVDALRAMIDAGLKVTINSDDPAYMDSEYITAVMQRAARTSRLSRAELVQISRTAFQSAWLPPAAKAPLLARLDHFARIHRL